MERRPLRASSVAELYDQTFQTLPVVDKTTSTKLSIYYKSSREVLAKARLFKMEGDLEGAYLFMLKYVLLLSRILPKHPQYFDPSMQNEVDSGKRIVLKVMDDVEQIKKQLEQLYSEEKASKEKEKERIKSLEVQEREREKSRQSQMDLELNRKKAEEREKQRIDDLKKALEDQDNMIPSFDMNQQRNMLSAQQTASLLDLSFLDPDNQEAPTLPQSTMDLSFLEEHFPNLSTSESTPNQTSVENNDTNLLDTDFLTNQLSSSSSTKDTPMFSHLTALKGPHAQKVEEQKKRNTSQNNAPSKEINISYPSVAELPPPSKMPTNQLRTSNTYTPSPITSNLSPILPPTNLVTTQIPTFSPLRNSDSIAIQETIHLNSSPPALETSLLQQLLPQPTQSSSPVLQQSEQHTLPQTIEQTIPQQVQTPVQKTEISTSPPLNESTKESADTAPPSSPVIQQQSQLPLQQLLPPTQQSSSQQQQQYQAIQPPSSLAQQPVFNTLPPTVHRSPFYQTPQFIPTAYSTPAFIHPSQAAAFKPPFSVPAYQPPILSAGLPPNPSRTSVASPPPTSNSTNSTPSYTRNSNNNGNSNASSNVPKVSVKTPQVNDVPSIPMIGAAVQSNPSPTSSKLRKLILYAEMFSSFMQVAASNTNRRIETCGILSGVLEGDVFTVTTLIIPKQEGTTDTCGTTDETELFEYQFGNDLLTLGWIHTHPTQDCFLSSVDLHTHASYQYLLSEAVAVVMAPSRSPNFGIFRLSDPPGLQIVQGCKLKGFHPHTRSDGGSLYTLCPHIELIWGKKNYKVVDLR